MRYFLLIILGLFLFSPTANAACPVAPVGSTSDTVIQMKAIGGNAGTGPTNVLDATEEGAIVYDDTNDTVKVCDGTNWVSVGGGITSESDPQVSAVTNGKWCRGDGSAVTCDQTAPSGGGTSGTVTGGGIDGSGGSCSLWGVATCIPAGFGWKVKCPTGTAQRFTGNDGGAGSGQSVYICVVN